MAQHSMPFGTGSRVCGGQNLAQLMLKISVAAVVRNFDIDAPPETNENTMEMRDSFVSEFRGACVGLMFYFSNTKVIFPASMQCNLIFKPRHH
jgi:Cytochrome P450